VPVNEAMAIRGYGPGHVRLPLTRLSEELRPALETVLADLDPLEAEA
jgi:4-hydroxy-tetrahydrodipicolinate synthase